MLIYVDSSVALAHVFGKRRAPSPPFWLELKVSSRLLEYEIWNRLHAHGRADTHGGMARDLLGSVELVDMSRAIVSRALDAFPVPVRALDGLHLATIEFLRRSDEEIELASYDRRLIAAAEALGIPIAAL